MLRFLLFIVLTGQAALAQTDSVTISGRIRNLTPRLYRQSPNVLISRNNLLQPNAELTRPAPLNPDGTYSVKMPVLFNQEEMYFSFGSVNTAFLAAPGSITIDLNADSLFRVAIPFTFGGVNARVNSQYARYKAFEAKQTKPDFERLSQQVSGQDLTRAFSIVQSGYRTPLDKFGREVEKPFPLTQQWITNTNRYNSAAFVYDIASAEMRTVPRSLEDSLRPANDPILTAARTVAGGRLTEYIAQSNAQGGAGVPVKRLAGLLLRYGQKLTDEERSKLTQWQSANSVRASDLRYIQRMIERSPDTLQRVVNYEILIDKARAVVDTPSVELVMAGLLAGSFSTSSIRNARLLYSYVRPQLTNSRIIQSLNELYALAVSDSARIRKAIDQLKPKTRDVTELTSGIFVLRDEDLTGGELLNRWLSRTRSRLVYVLLWALDEEANRRSVTLAQQLREQYDPGELSILYVGVTNNDNQRLLEYLIRNNLRGDHLVVTTGQYQNLLSRLGASDLTGAFLLSSDGNVIRANTLLPDQNADLTKLIDRRLQKR